MSYPRSMTAFGRGEAVDQERTWTAEVRSLNHRYRDIKVRLPRQYAPLEETIKREVAGAYSRGHVEVSLYLTGQAAGPSLAVNLPLAREYLRGLEQLRDELNLTGRPDLAMLRELPGVLSPVEERAEEPEAAWPLIRAALGAALANTGVMRESEGEATKRELLARLARIRQVLHQLESDLPALTQRRQDKLRERLENLLNGVDLDPWRLAQEVALLADRSDISEEMVRLASHLDQFASFLEADEPTGRRLDFLLQEFFREINTIASKISDSRVAHLSVELKNEVEKMREQVQNLE